MLADEAYFAPVRLTHDDVVRRLLSARKQMTLKQVAEAFLASLSTRRLDLRSALGSFSYAAHFPDHELTSSPSYRAPSGNIFCEICGIYSPPGGEPVEHNLNVLNFNRFKYGGVLHSDPIYAWFDLDQFVASDRPSPSEEDYAILRAIIDVADNMPRQARANALKKALSKLFPSNDAERRILVECLAMCGVLAPTDRPGFLEAFSTAAHLNRDRPNDHTNDWGYPAIWWRGADGVDSQMLRLCFPEMGRRGEG